MEEEIHRMYSVHRGPMENDIEPSQTDKIGKSAEEAIHGQLLILSACECIENVTGSANTADLINQKR